MANFSPKWDLVLDSTTIIEGQSTYARLRLSKQSNTDVSSDYNLNSNQYLQISYTINLNGDTVQERDYNVNVGESTSTLLPIANAGTGNNKINGTHVVKFNKKQFHLSTSYLDTYFIEIVCPKDGIWDSSQNVTVTLNSVQVYEVEDSQIVSISSSGIIGTSKITLQYDNTFDSWVTPDLITHQKNLYTVGEIAYGSESRIFIQAYGFSGTADDDNDPYPLDTSTRVFVPTYKLVDMNINDIPSTHITGKGTILVPSEENETPIPSYPITAGTTRNQINSFYMKNVASLMDGAGCIIQGSTLTDHDNSLYYYYGFRFYGSSTGGTKIRIMVPSECEEVYVGTLNSVSSGAPNTALYEFTESTVNSNSVIGRCDIYGNVKFEPKEFTVYAHPQYSQTVLFIRVKIDSANVPPWVSFTAISAVNATTYIKSSNTLDNTIYISTSSTALDAVGVNNIVNAANAGSGYTFSFNANNNKSQVPNNIEPVEVKKEEENKVLVLDNTGSFVDSGMKFNGNGQFLQSLLYDSDPIDAYFTAEIVPLTYYYNSESSAFYEGKRFKAYQMWIAPSDVSIFTETSRPLPGHLYQLKDTKIYPYVAKSEVYQGETKLVFDPEVWNDLGVYSNKLGESIIGLQKMFRMVLNNNDSAGISFDTDPNLGIIHVGEYFGHSRYPKISASGADLITYTLSSDSRDDITKYNLNLTADGYMVGTAYCKTSDFDANDEVQLKFNVIATTSKGSSIKQEFQLTIIPGFGQNYISSELKMSTAFERAYFKCISSKQFNNYKYYRESDPHYGRKTVPSILLKENFVNPTLQWTDIKDVKSRLRDGIIDTVNGSVIPDSTFQYVVGNYKVITAVDNNGNELYDVLYREMLPFGSNPKPEEDPRQYNVQDYFTLTEVYGIRQNIYNVLGEDVKNLNTDPDDFANRAVSVPELDSVTVAMVDTVPRFMAHAMTENGVKNGYRPMMVVAYCNAGEGDLLFDNLVTSSEYKNMLGEIIEVQYVNFKYFSEEDGKYVQQNFAIPIPFKTLIA